MPRIKILTEADLRGQVTLDGDAVACVQPQAAVMGGIGGGAHAELGRAERALRAGPGHGAEPRPGARLGRKDLVEQHRVPDPLTCRRPASAARRSGSAARSGRTGSETAACR